ncbi:MAG: hypothetical protein B7Z13_04005, partial [Caulobacterales bacterium 32-67-6]
MTDSTPPNPAVEAPAKRSLLQRWWFDVVLWKRILLALVLGVIAGLLLGEQANAIKWIGDLFVRLIRMIVVPLVFVSIVAGVAGMGDPRRLGSIGGKTIFLYLLTTAIAVGVGMAMGLLFGPGQGVSFTGVNPEMVGSAPPVSEQLLGIVPLNPIQALAN